MKFYHGSFNKHEPGTRLSGRGEAYERDWEHTDFYAILERFRPDEHIPHKNAVFMVGHPDDVDLAGGATDWCHEMLPEGRITRHDLNWGSEISMLMGDGHSADSPSIKLAADNYWNGIPHQDEQVWEYIAEAATVINVEEWEEYDAGHEPPTDQEWNEYSANRTRASVSGIGAAAKKTTP